MKNLDDKDLKLLFGGGDVFGGGNGTGETVGIDDGNIVDPNPETSNNAGDKIDLSSPA